MKFPLTVEHSDVDPTFSFMTVDWDGKIRMIAPHPTHGGLVAQKDKFDVAFACDTDQRPPWGGDAERGPAQSQPLPLRGHFVPLPEPAGTGARKPGWARRWYRAA